MARWHGDEAKRSRLRHAAEDTKDGDKGRGGGGTGSCTDTAVDECRNEMIDRVAGYRFDYLLHIFACVPSPSYCFVRAADIHPSWVRMPSVWQPF